WPWGRDNVPRDVLVLLLTPAFRAGASLASVVLGRSDGGLTGCGETPQVNRRAAQMRRRFCGRQPLCGTGVTSEIELMRMPSEASARTDDSRPGPGPLMRTSRVLMPWSCAARPAFSAATWAANGVDLREPLKPWPPLEAHASA